KLYRDRANGTCCTVDKYLISFTDLFRTYIGQRIMAAFGQGCRCGKIQTIGNQCQSFILPDYLILRVSAKMIVVVTEHPVSSLKSGNLVPNGFDYSGKLTSEHLMLRSEQPAEQPGDKILCASESAVRTVHRACVYPDQYLVGFGSRGRYLRDMHYIRTSI